MAEASFDFVVVGGGVVGSSIGLGLARRGARVAILDQGDTALRSSRVNFGLVWLQSKGDGMPEYGRWTRRSADLWTEFAAYLQDLSGIDPEHEQKGGIAFCLGEAEFEHRRNTIQRMHNQVEPWVYETRMIDRKAVEALYPGVRFGPEMVGASFGPHDGVTNPLRLLQSLHGALKRVGIAYRPDAPAQAIQSDGGGFVIDTPAGPFRAGKVVLAAGHGTTGLAATLGLEAPIVPERGQLIITERVAPILPIPASGVRQTRDGTIMIGTTHEAAPDLTTRATTANAVHIAERIVRLIPDMARVKMVRTWLGLRVLSPDGFPVYMESETHPGAYVAICHSGNTLAAVHANDLAEAFLAHRLPDTLAPFHPRRFHVSQAA
ncbi:glycine/D-amino acid oxidase-like deaminating enzyme [Stella humosa]|uniref:Glycine/D-amino acid oxidase-like deaminating enzyme n=1 Tax=Stella humosa TaxID=94 RepID=A0A3N1M9Q3_9PROT|nr:FAD-dependent oxidoreductase [Stella humosa]ROP99958.1 glycine/D-amino acid oxidase-like deaminating enzyme [Stella humosa]BBK30811.1 FAD-dependent oxidoreductase [Stella humosa]